MQNSVDEVQRLTEIARLAYNQKMESEMFVPEENNRNVGKITNFNCKISRERKYEKTHIPKVIITEETTVKTFSGKNPERNAIEVQINIPKITITGITGYVNQSFAI